jgi:hypothetical protein
LKIQENVTFAPIARPAAYNTPFNNFSTSGFLFCDSDDYALRFFDISSIPSNLTYNTQCSMLQCDPQLTTFPATVELSSKGQLNINAINDASALGVGNLPMWAAAGMSSYGWIDALAPLRELGSNGTQAYATPTEATLKLFAKGANISSSGLYELTYQGLDSINSQMDLFFSSLVKTYVTGFDFTNTSTTTVGVPATIKSPALVLSTTKLLLVAVVALVLVLLVSLLAAMVWSPDNSRPFDLKSILETWQGGKKSSGPV